MAIFEKFVLMGMVHSALDPNCTQMRQGKDEEGRSSILAGME